MNITNHYQMIMGEQKFLDAVVYEPSAENGRDKRRKQIGILLIHSHDSYLGHPAASGLAEEGFTVLTMNVSDPDACFDAKLEEVALAVDFMKTQLDLTKIILLGHSGGASLMSAYQAIAENGAHVFRSDRFISPCTIDRRFTMADGMLLLDSNWGNGAMTVLSMDPEVEEQDGVISWNAEFDYSSRSVGYSPDGSHYAPEFLRKYQKAQAERNNRIVREAVERWTQICRGEGKFVDDEPLVIPGGSQLGPCNKLFPQDVSLLSETKEKHSLLHPDGSVTQEIVHSLRKPRPAYPLGKSMRPGAQITSVRTFLDSYAVYAAEDGSFGCDTSGVYGIDYDSSYNCTPGNVKHVTVPALIMGMTGGYEFLASELIFQNYAGKGKTLTFAEGMNHMLLPAWDCEVFPGQYQTAPAQTFRFIGNWLEQRFIK